jgi:formylglycine-generating enzyme required for sulfatase activity
VAPAAAELSRSAAEDFGVVSVLDPSGAAVELVRIPPGSFLMGSRNQLFSETPAHEVYFAASYLMGRLPVTRAQWLAVMGDDPSSAGDTPDCPVDGVSWDMAQEFCCRLGERSRRRVRLPSEAEWEYACRASTTGEYFCGPWGPHLDDSEVPWATREALCEYAWYDLNSGGGTRPVGGLRPNPWGLHDVLGNVWEWCADTWHDDYIGAPANGTAWEVGADQEPRRCLRGGAWDMNAFRCRSPYRSFDYRQLGTSRFGLRVAADAEPGAAADRGRMFASGTS